MYVCKHDWMIEINKQTNNVCDMLPFDPASFIRPWRYTLTPARQRNPVQSQNRCRVQVSVCPFTFSSYRQHFTALLGYIVVPHGLCPLWGWESVLRHLLNALITTRGPHAHTAIVTCGYIRGRFPFAKPAVTSFKGELHATYKLIYNESSFY